MLVKCVVDPRTKVYMILIYILTKLFPVVGLVPRDSVFSSWYATPEQWK